MSVMALFLIIYTLRQHYQLEVRLLYPYTPFQTLQGRFYDSVLQLSAKFLKKLVKGTNLNVT
jgi:hypothetical protein